MKAALRLSVILLAAGLVVFWWLSRPLPLGPDFLPEHRPDLLNGERIFNVGGCASCHGKEVDGGHSRELLAGGLALETAYGTFYVPNVSPDPVHGIGGWSNIGFVNAMQLGIAPDGRHYYPSFPYTSYARMSVTDLLDLKAYLDSMPSDSKPSRPHELGFPYGFRRVLGIWKRLHLDSAPVKPVESGNELLSRGRYLVEGPGHCGECHTPRTRLGGLRLEAWMQGAPSPVGEGRVPDLTASEKGLADWSEGDIVFFLDSGIDPDFDVVGGNMVAVHENIARLPDVDREAIAAYLKSLD